MSRGKGLSREETRLRAYTQYILEYFETYEKVEISRQFIEFIMIKHKHEDSEKLYKSICSDWLQENSELKEWVENAFADKKMGMNPAQAADAIAQSYAAIRIAAKSTPVLEKRVAADDKPVSTSTPKSASTKEVLLKNRESRSRKRSNDSSDSEDLINLSFKKRKRIAIASDSEEEESSTPDQSSGSIRPEQSSGSLNSILNNVEPDEANAEVAEFPDRPFSPTSLPPSPINVKHDDEINNNCTVSKKENDDDPDAQNVTTNDATSDRSIMENDKTVTSALLDPNLTDTNLTNSRSLNDSNESEPNISAILGQFQAQQQQQQPPQNLQHSPMTSAIYYPMLGSVPFALHYLPNNIASGTLPSQMDNTQFPDRNASSDNASATKEQTADNTCNFHFGNNNELTEPYNAFQAQNVRDQASYYVCDLCPGLQVFDTEAQLHEHLKRDSAAHAQGVCNRACWYVCDFCSRPQVFDAETQLRKHMDLCHNYICRYCNNSEVEEPDMLTAQ